MKIPCGVVVDVPKEDIASASLLMAFPSIPQPSNLSFLGFSFVLYLQK